MAESLRGKVAVITGVGSGFAKATAELFARTDQVSLVLIDINEQALKATVDACEAAGSKVVSFVGDVTRPETFERALKETLAAFGKVDFLINYAGGAVKVAPIEEMDDAVNRKIIDLNLTSVIMSCRTFTPQFKRQGFGKIINVSSACDRRSWPGWSVYSAAKAGVNAFTKCLYTELRPHGIAVTLLVPGGSNTGFQGAAQGVNKFEWDESLAVRPEHFADMVYQACALTKGGCVSEMLVYGLAQDVSGF
ncbi:MAG TPA: SDR family oxidoreductase [Anaerolineae bacterium]|nr:SDR family oxidoreductase [Anaerolineae bacterium]HOQ97956.1 SDR family oxidoreductase [Anaerolineae bacterium]HPL28937.1 SDR family oxidoreductase [Anaerolineae bacterium]